MQKDNWNLFLQFRKGFINIPVHNFLTICISRHFHPCYSDILTHLMNLLLFFPISSQHRAEAFTLSCFFLLPHLTHLHQFNLSGKQQDCRAHCRKWCAYIANKTITPEMQFLGRTVCWKGELSAAKTERAKGAGLLVPCHWIENITASFKSGRKTELFVLASAILTSGIIATHLHETELYVI